MKAEGACFQIRTLLYKFLIGIGLLLAPSSRAAHEWFVPEPPLVTLNAGASQVCDTDQVFIWGVEYRPAYRFHHLGPWFHYGCGEHNETYLALGLLLNLNLGCNWFATVLFGPGYYEDNGNYDLGSEIEFRSGLELTHRFLNEHRLGLGISHLSNGPLGDRNPGTEMLYLLYAFPLGR